VRFSRDWFHEQVEDLRTEMELEGSARGLAEQALAFETDDLICDEEYFYLAVDGAIGWNSGVLGQVNADMVQRYDKQPGRPYQCEPLLHMHMQCKIFLIWMRNNIEAEYDPFFEFVSADDNSPVADLTWLIDNDARLSALALTLRKHVNRFVQTSSINYSNRRTIKQEEVLRAYGNSNHPVHEQLHNTLASSSLDLLANTTFTTFAYNVRAAIGSGELSELKNVSQAMKSMLEYRAQGTVRGNKWVEDHAGFVTELDSEERRTGGELLHEGAVVARWQARCRARLLLDLSWCNEMLVETLQDSAVATFCWQIKQWGSPVKVADMGHHGVVLKIHSKSTRTPFIIDWKSPSAGIDSSINQMGDINNGFGQYATINAELQQFYGASFSHDHTAGHMSNLSISTWLGCGVALNSDGTIDFQATSFRDDTFLAGYLTEHKKDQASSAASEDKAGTLEKFLGADSF